MHSCWSRVNFELKFVLDLHVTVKNTVTERLESVTALKPLLYLLDLCFLESSLGAAVGLAAEPCPEIGHLSQQDCSHLLEVSCRASTASPF